MRVCLALLVLLCYSCRKDPALWSIDNLNADNKVLVFGHGGMGYRSNLPMNSYESLISCLNRGANGVEMDLQLSKDNVLFLFHDRLLEDGTTCENAITKVNSSELKSCAYRKGQKKYLLISATEFFQRYKAGPQQLVTFDCKLENGASATRKEAFEQALVGLIKKYKLQDRSFVESSDAGFLSGVKSALPGAQVYLYCISFGAAAAAAKKTPLDGLTIDMDLISAAEISEAHAQNLRVSVFNAGTEKRNTEALLLSPDNIQTDCLEHLLEIYVNKQ